MRNENFPNIETAIVHDWMPLIGGGERVLQQMVRSFPQSTIYTLFNFLSEPELREIVGDKKVIESRLSALPFVRKYYRNLIMQCIREIENFKLTDYQLILSSSAALSKGVIGTPEQTHISYIHSPVRYAWDLTHDYIGSIGGFGGVFKRMIAREMMHRLRIWDIRTVPQVDYMIANSQFIRQRIWKTYRRDADVIYPPVDTDSFSLSTKQRGDYFFTASRMVPYKNMHLIVEAFSQRPDLKLVVSGDGPELGRLKKFSNGNIEFIGHAPFDVVRDYMQTARAFVFAAKEDFGIVPVEAQACGTPVIALNKGGTAETVNGLDHSCPTGVHFETPTVLDICNAIEKFEAEEDSFQPNAIAAHAKSFSAARFRQELVEYVEARVR